MPFARVVNNARFNQAVLNVNLDRVALVVERVDRETGTEVMDIWYGGDTDAFWTVEDPQAIASLKQAMRLAK